MPWALLLAVAAPQDASALMAGAEARLRAGCVGECDAPRPDRRYRIERDEEEAVGLKERAVNDTGGRCSVVGARVCTRKPRTIFSTDLRR